MSFDGRKVKEILLRLSAGKINYIIVGGVAELLQASTRIPNRLEICVPFKDLKKLAEILKPLNPKAEKDKNVIIRTDFGDIEVVREVKPIGTYSKLLKESEIMDIDGADINVLTVPALIKIRTAEENWFAVAELEAIIEIKREMDIKTATDLVGYLSELEEIMNYSKDEAESEKNRIWNLYNSSDKESVELGGKKVEFVVVDNSEINYAFGAGIEDNSGQRRIFIATDHCVDVFEKILSNYNIKFANDLRKVINTIVVSHEVAELDNKDSILHRHDIAVEKSKEVARTLFVGVNVNIVDKILDEFYNCIRDIHNEKMEEQDRKTKDNGREM